MPQIIQISDGTEPIAAQAPSISLVRDQKGHAIVTVDNFFEIFTHDPYYSGVRYNLLSNRPELHQSNEIRPWTDTEDAFSRAHIETHYHLYHVQKHRDALRKLFKVREFHPIIDIIETLQWDGVPRIESFLTQWAKADDTPYVREVSRLIFAGGMNRLYRPGCKFEDVPVLIGTNQGEGKSTLVKWLAINDAYYADIPAFEGKESIEQLDGVWIGEVAELLALTKTKEQEAVKSYLSRQFDRSRRPYSERIEELPRRCIFIGTTNNDQFLRDKTGNRRFFPVIVHSNGYDLYDHEEECRSYILQCWAEAKHRFDLGQLPNFADRSLHTEYEAAQEAALEDDWRIGAIGEFLERKAPGDLTCVRELAHCALSPEVDHPRDPTKKDALEIGQIMSKYFPEWEKEKQPVRMAGYGLQRCWCKSGVEDEDFL